MIEDEPRAESPRLDPRPAPACGTPVSVTPRALRDPADEAGDPRLQARPVLAAREVRRHVVAADLAGEAVGDELLEVVADLDPHRRSFTASTTSRPLSLPLSPMPRPRFSNILTAYSSDVGVRRETCRSSRRRRHRRWPASARECAARFRLRSPASMTFAKSLTGLVSSGGGGCAYTDARNANGCDGCGERQRRQRNA